MSSAARREEEEEAGLVRPAYCRPEIWTTSRSTQAILTSPPIPEAPASIGILSKYSSLLENVSESRQKMVLKKGLKMVGNF